MTDELKDADAIEAADQKYMMRPWTHPKGEPVIVAKARGSVITDIRGKEYLDLTAGYFVNNIRSLSSANRRGGDEADGRGAAGLRLAMGPSRRCEAWPSA